MLKRYPTVVATAVVASLLLGFGAAGARAEDKPLTEKEKKDLKASIKDYKGAMTKVKAYRDKVRKETTSADGDPEDAHRALDELTLVLEWLPEFAKTSGVPEDSLEDLTKSAQKLSDLFDKIHANIDAKKAPNYQAVAKGIEGEIKRLDALTPKS
jgi:hypothetical protein